MHPEIENLIEMALADGEVTEKERAIILRKAKALGEDIDEVEMILDAKLHLTQKSSYSPPLTVTKSNKHGGIKKCPSCGETIVAMSTNCSLCGHEFSETQANSTLIKLLAIIEEINKPETNSKPLSTVGKLVNDGLDLKKKNILKSEAIINFPIPTNKADVLEFLTYCVPKSKDNSIDSFIDPVSSISNAWKTKSEEVIMKCKIMFSSDHDFLDQLLVYEKQQQRNSKFRKNIIIFGVGIVATIIILIVLTEH